MTLSQGHFSGLNNFYKLSFFVKNIKKYFSVEKLFLLLFHFKKPIVQVLC